MLRFVQLLVGLVVVALAAAFTLYLSHAPLAAPATSAIDGLAAPARVDWFDRERPLVVEATSEADAMRALGYALAIEDAWSMLVWRQAARGRLAEWLGPSVLPQDRHVRLLGIARGADSAAARLDDATHARLDAFCDGINAAFATRPVERDAQVALLGVDVDPWTIADVVAAERLAAWLSGEMPASPFPSVPLDAVASADARLRDLLATDGLAHSRAWTFVGPDPDAPSLTANVVPSSDTMAASQRAALDRTPVDTTDGGPGEIRRLVATYVTGQQATPFLRAAEVRVAGQASRLLLLLPGTPFPVAGAHLADDGSATDAWAVLPRRDARWEAVPAGTEVTMVAERMTVSGGQEAVLYAPLVGGSATVVAQPPPQRRVVRRDSVGRNSVVAAAGSPVWPDSDSSDAAGVDSALRQAPAAVDTVVTRLPAGRWRLVWPGTTAGSDAAAWLSLWDGRPAPMRLVGIEGLVATREGAVPIGAATPHRRGLVAADSTVRTRLAARLDRRSVLPAWPTDDAVRDGAREAAAALVTRIDDRRLNRPIERTALDILRNWDGSYDANSIGATLFEALSDVERDERGRDAFAASRDTAYFSGLRLTTAFQTAVRRLITDHGVDPSEWRRGAVLPQAWRFAFWGAPPLDLPAPRRYAPLDVPGGGHPAALAYGPVEPYGASVVVELDVSLTPGVPVRLRRAAVDADRMLGRYRASLDRPVVSLETARPRRSTTLTPASSAR